MARVMCAIALLAAALAPRAARGQIFVENNVGGDVEEYGLDGTPMNTSLIPWLHDAEGIAASGSNLFVTYDNFTINEYTMSGATVSAPWVGGTPGSPPSGLGCPYGIAVSGSNVFVANQTYDTVDEYTLTGTPVSVPFVTGLRFANAIAASESDVFVINGSGVSEYTTAGALVNASLLPSSSWLEGLSGFAISGSNLFTVSSTAIGEYTLGATPGTIASSNPSLITGLNNGYGIAVLGSDIYVTTDGLGLTGAVGEYTTSGGVVNADLISGLDTPYGIVVVPEPATGAIAVVAGLALLARRPRRGRTGE